MRHWIELPAVSGADNPISLDKPVADAAAIVWTVVCNDDQPAALESSHRHRLGAAASGHDRADGDIATVGSQIEGGQLCSPVIGIIAQLIDNLCLERAHPPTVRAPPDTDATGVVHHIPCHEASRVNLDPIGGSLYPQATW